MYIHVGVGVYVLEMFCATETTRHGLAVMT